MVHRENIEHYSGTLHELAEEVCNLRYDALAEFLRALATKLAADAAADEGRGRPSLAAALQATATNIANAAADMERTWCICAPHME